MTAPVRYGQRVCGIAGIHSPSGEPSRELLAAMVAAQEHRGPDGEGRYHGSEIALGVRRLAIVDLEHGDQPLYDERRTVAVVFNGEIYNHAELRRWLEGRGHRIESGSDGAVLPHLYEELGEAFVEHLNGIFAIALWDDERRVLHLARDQLGVKPLYWSRRGTRTTFASEIKALLLDPEVPRELDHGAVDEFLTLRFVPSPRTLLRAVRKVPPATLISIEEAGVRERRYWTPAMPAARRDTAVLEEEYADTFERAVVRQLMSDRPMGVMLSGGLDSAAVAAVMARHLPTVRAFTVGFEDGGDSNELAAAAATARLLGAAHESVVIGAREYLERLPESLLTLEEPVGTTSALAVRYVAALMRPHVPVALSGQGADEPLAGYGRHLGASLARRLRRLGPAPRITSRLATRVRGEQLRRGLGVLGARDDLDLLMRAYAVFGPGERRRLYSPEFAASLVGPGAAQAVEERRSEVAGLDPLSQMLYVDTRLSLPDELLMIADKMSMAESVELRVPFLDRELVTLVESMHPSQKLRGRTGKWIHKRALRRWLPPEIVERRKLGWETPLRSWLRAELRPLLEEVLLGEGELCRELFEPRELRTLIDAHASGAHDRSRELFCLLSLGLWHRGFAAAPATVA